MSALPSAPGFSIQNESHSPGGGHTPIQHQPGYQHPSHQHQNVNPPQYPGHPPYGQQPYYPAYQPQQALPQQPFGTPMQQAAGYSQPQAIQWMTGNFQTYLASATNFIVKQKKELLEVFVGWETANKYTVKDQAGNQVFFVGEESGCLTRQCCGSCRPFTLTVKDNRGNTIMEFSRDLDCGCCFGCCGDALRVTAPGGQFLGSIQEECSILFPSYKIKNATGQTVLRIKGPLCAQAIFCNAVSFEVVDMNGTCVGRIKKEWGGVIREFFTDADTFSISFPLNADPSVKAVLLGALFMIDFNYFESGGGNDGGGRKLFS